MAQVNHFSFFLKKICKRKDINVRFSYLAEVEFHLKLI